MRSEPIPIACTLDGPSVADRVAEWRAVLSHAIGRTDQPGGVRVEFPADGPVQELARLMAAEQQCCQFFSFALTVDGRGIGLEVSAPEDGRAVLDALFS